MLVYQKKLWYSWNELSDFEKKYILKDIKDHAKKNYLTSGGIDLVVQIQGPNNIFSFNYNNLGDPIKYFAIYNFNKKKNQAEILD